ncbi:AraC family transcriptional regulator, partial [Pseudomonas sp. GW460-13]
MIMGGQAAPNPHPNDQPSLPKQSELATMKAHIPGNPVPVPH